MKHSTVEEFKRGDITIKFVGTVHIGTKEYYSQINEELNDDSYLVLYEGSSGEKEKSIASYYRNISDVLKLRFQNDEIKKKHNWINVDIPWSVISLMINTDDATNIMSQDISSNSLLKQVLIQMRDNFVIQKTFEQISFGETQIIILYGQNHLKGIKSFLLKSNFSHKKIKSLKSQ